MGHRGGAQEAEDPPRAARRRRAGARLEEDVLPVTTAPVVAFDPYHAHGVGRLLGQAGSSDVVDTHVVYVAGSRHATVVTGDGGDLRRLAGCLSPPLPVRDV